MPAPTLTSRAPRPTRRALRPPRVSIRDAVRTRALILKAAAGEFARAGLGGARVERISAEAGVNVRMLYYYFGSKDELFLAVLERAYATIRRAEQGLALDSVAPEEAMRRLVRFTWRFQVGHPDFITLLNSENLHRGRHQAQSSLVAGLHAPLLELIERQLERGARDSVFRRGVDPMQLYVTIAGLGYFYLSNRHTLSAIFRRDLMSARQRELRLAHMIDVVLGYLRPGASEDRP